MGWLFRSDNYLIGRRMLFSTLIPICVKTGRWSAKLLSIICRKSLFSYKNFTQINVYKEIDVGKLILLLHVEDLTFIYPTK